MAYLTTSTSQPLSTDVPKVETRVSESGSSLVTEALAIAVIQFRRETGQMQMKCQVSRGQSTVKMRTVMWSFRLVKGLGLPERLVGLVAIRVRLPN